MKKLILLAGLHKTGTTSIQKTCRMNLPLLNEAGYAYPLFPLSGPNGGAAPKNHSTFIRTMFKLSLRKKTTVKGATIEGSDALSKAE